MCEDHNRFREKILERLRALGAPHAEELVEFCMRVRDALAPHMIILHGSVARGLHGPWSDIDVIVVADFRESFLDRILRLLELAEPSLPVEPLGYTPEELERMLEQLNPLVLDALEFGVPLLGEERFRALRRRLEELKHEGLQRDELGWGWAR